MASFLSASFYNAYAAHLFVCDNIKDIICLGLLFGTLNASVASEFGMGASLSFRQILVSLPQDSVIILSIDILNTFRYAAIKTK